MRSVKKRLVLAKTVPEKLDADFIAIEKAIGFASPNDALRRELRDFGRRWQDKKRHSDDHAKPGDYVRALETVRRDAAKLLGHLNSSDPTTALEAALLVLLGGKQACLIRALELIVGTADVEVENASGKRGRLPETGFRRALEELIVIYERATGRRASVSHTGPFFRFVSATLERFAPGLSRQEAALGKAIQRFIKERRGAFTNSNKSRRSEA